MNIRDWIMYITDQEIHKLWSCIRMENMFLPRQESLLLSEEDGYHCSRGIALLNVLAAGVPVGIWQSWSRVHSGEVICAVHLQDIPGTISQSKSNIKTKANETVQLEHDQICQKSRMISANTSKISKVCEQEVCGMMYSAKAAITGNPRIKATSELYKLVLTMFANRMICESHKEFHLWRWVCSTSGRISSPELLLWHSLSKDPWDHTFWTLLIN